MSALLAVAWRRVILLYVLERDTEDPSKIKMYQDGIFCSEDEIEQVAFLAESVLAVMISQRKKLNSAFQQSIRTSTMRSGP